MNQDKIKFFGYGTLINKISLLKTIPNAQNIFPARLNGFIRVFNVLESKRLTRQNGGKIAVLSIEKSKFNDCINGVCFEINKEDIEILQEREKQYEMVQVEIEDWNNVDNKYKVYVWIAKHFEFFDFQFNSLAQKEYLDICLDGCKCFGKDYLNKFMKTTFIKDRSLSELIELS